jgi:hypothetical protein
MAQKYSLPKHRYHSEGVSEDLSHLTGSELDAELERSKQSLAESDAELERSNQRLAELDEAAVDRQQKIHDGVLSAYRNLEGPSTPAYDENRFREEEEREEMIEASRINAAKMSKDPNRLYDDDEPPPPPAWSKEEQDEYDERMKNMPHERAQVDTKENFVPKNDRADSEDDKVQGYFNRKATSAWRSVTPASWHGNKKLGGLHFSLRRKRNKGGKKSRRKSNKKRKTSKSGKKGKGKSLKNRKTRK